MTSNTSDVTAEGWAQRIAHLTDAERARRVEAVSVLLNSPDDLCDLLETELHILREYLTRPGETRTPPG